jgi:hypothetical protein
MIDGLPFKVVCRTGVTRFWSGPAACYRPWDGPRSGAHVFKGLDRVAATRAHCRAEERAPSMRRMDV